MGRGGKYFNFTHHSIRLFGVEGRSETDGYCFRSVKVNGPVVPIGEIKGYKSTFCRIRCCLEKTNPRAAKVMILDPFAAVSLFLEKRLNPRVLLNAREDSERITFFSEIGINLDEGRLRYFTLHIVAKADHAVSLVNVKGEILAAD